jgi:glutamine synthetase
VKDTPRALDFYVAEKAAKIFEKHKVLTKVELEARHEIMLENYIMKVQIESRVMGDLVMNHIIPTAINYQSKLVQTAKGLKELGIDASELISKIEEINGHVSKIRKLTNDMTEERKRINKIDSSRDMAIEYGDNVKNKYFDEIRYSVDKLELLIDDEDWPLVKYRELLFLR